MKPEDVPDGPLLIDTDVVSYWLIGTPEGKAFEDLVAGHEQAISFATYGELLAIHHRLKWGQRRLDDLRTRLRGFVVIPYTAAVAEHWAQMHAKLSGHLQGGGTNDLWTAACALAVQPNLPIVTNNLSDFQTIAKDFPVQIVHPSV